jgi:hypothetical protein
MSFSGLTIRQPVVVGRMSKRRLGALINVVDDPLFECPECWTPGPVEVYAPAVRWPCGHTRSLPPLPRDHRISATVVRLRDHRKVA